MDSIHTRLKQAVDHSEKQSFEISCCQVKVEMCKFEQENAAAAAAAVEVTWAVLIYEHLFKGRPLLVARRGGRLIFFLLALQKKQTNSVNIMFPHAAGVQAVEDSCH